MAQKSKAKANASFFSKLALQSSKAKLIVFLVVFAVIGGGYMAYRSFAAEKSYDFLVSQGLSANPPFEVVKSGDIRVVKETSGQKKELDVVKMTGNSSHWASLGAFKRPQDQNPQDTQPKYFKPGSYKVCALIKAENSEARFILRMAYENARGGDPFMSGGGQTARVDEYTKVCETMPSTNHYTWPSIIVGRGSVRVSTLSVTSASGANKTITMSIENSGLTGRDGGAVVTETAGSKKGLKVIRINDQRNAAASASNNQAATQSLRNFLEQHYGDRVRLCAFVRPNRSLRVKMIGAAQREWHQTTVDPNESQSYQYICTPYETLSDVNVRGYSVPEIRNNEPSKGDALNVWGLVLESL